MEERGEKTKREEEMVLKHLGLYYLAYFAIFLLVTKIEGGRAKDSGYIHRTGS